MEEKHISEKNSESNPNMVDSSSVKPPKSAVREWVESIIIAFILAMFIRTFFIQAFKIPSGSMKMTLIERDRLMVNKLRYGPKVPLTRSARLPGYSQPQRGDIIVFKYPDSTLILESEIEDWSVLAKSLKNPQSPLAKEYAKTMNPLILQNIKEMPLKNRFSLPLRKSLVRGLNELKSRHDLINKINSSSGLLEDKTVKKLLRKLIKEEVLIYKNGEYAVNQDMSYSQRMDIEWMNLVMIRKAFPGALNKKFAWEKPKRDFIKRLIAFGGETVEIREGDIYINGKLVENPVIKNFYYYNRFDSEYGKEHQVVKVPEGAVFVLGDNSGSSHDSRFWGFVPEEFIIGRAELIYWPFKRMRLLK